MSSEPIRETPAHRYDGNLYSLLSDIKRDLEELDSVVRSLPRVDRDGGSECPFADKIYAKKELAAHKVAELLVQAREALAVTDNEIDRLNHNIDIIVRDSDEVVTPATQKKYDDASTSEREQLSRAQKSWDMLKAAIIEMERTLAYAEKLSYPGMPVQRVPPKPEPPPDPEKADEEEWENISRGYASVQPPPAPTSSHVAEEEPSSDQQATGPSEHV